MCAWTVLRAGDAVGVLLSYHSHRDHGLHPLLLDQSQESGLIFFFLKSACSGIGLLRGIHSRHTHVKSSQRPLDGDVGGRNELLCKIG